MRWNEGLKHTRLTPNRPPIVAQFLPVYTRCAPPVDARPMYTRALAGLSHQRGSPKTTCKQAVNKGATMIELVMQGWVVGCVVGVGIWAVRYAWGRDVWGR